MDSTFRQLFHQDEKLERFVHLFLNLFCFEIYFHRSRSRSNSRREKRRRSRSRSSGMIRIE